jgi:hypothetical protein
MNKAMLLQPGIELKISGRHGKIVYVDNDRVVIGYADGKSDVYGPMDLLQAINDRLIGIIDKPTEIRCVINTSDEDQAECDRREAYCRAFFQFKQENPTKGLTQELVDEVYAEIEDEHPIKPSIKRIYAWNKPWLADGKDMALQVVKQVESETVWRTPDVVLEFMDKMIQRYYMKDSLPTKVWAYDKFVNGFKRQGKKFKDYDVPSSSTFERRIKSWPKYEKDLARYGKKHADRENREASKTYNVQSVLELVEVDGLEVNLGLLNDDGSYAGKVGIIAAMDLKTRACIGYTVVIGLKPKESAAAVVHCLSNSMRFKSTPEQSSASGIALNYVFDNGPGFRSMMTKKFMNAIGSDITYCRSGAPEEKPHVERMFRSWRDKFFRGLPGYLHKRDIKKAQEKTIKQAAKLTVAEFMVMFEDYIHRCYSNHPNRMMNNWSPNQMWEEHARIDEIITLADFDDRTKLRGNAKTLRCNRNHGIPHRGQRFCSTELLQEANYLLGGASDISIPMDVLIDDFDASAITVLIGQRMIEVPNVKNVARDTSFSYLKSFEKTIDKSKLEQPLTRTKAANIIKKHRKNGTLIEQDSLIIDEEITSHSTTNMEKDIADNINNITDEERSATNGFSFKRKNSK